MNNPMDFVKLFEIEGDSQHFYLLTQSNENVRNPANNIYNPYFSVVSI